MATHDLHDLEIVLRSAVPLVVIETREEARALDMLQRLVPRLGLVLFRWTITEGLRRMEPGYGAQHFAAAPHDALAHVKTSTQPGVYVLIDFHPYLDDPVNLRLIKEIALASESQRQIVVLLSHAVQVPAEIEHLTARFELSLPDAALVRQIVREEAARWSTAHGGRKVRTDGVGLDMLVRNLGGLTATDVRRLARKAIVDDGAITRDDLPDVAEAKHALLSRGGGLSFEHDAVGFADVGGLAHLKRWLADRRAIFVGERSAPGLDPPRGVLLCGVQGSGKSLAARAVAGVWGVPLLRLDMGTLYDRFMGETERNIRESLRTAEAMAPCVLWLDEIEKGLSTGGAEQDGGTSRRVLGTLLTWMSEARKAVFLVATANDITALPPELVRKGRFDEIFFVDLPAPPVRADILRIHLTKRGHDPTHYDLDALAAATDGFSGAELEQAVVSTTYRALSDSTRNGGDGGDDGVTTEALLDEVARTRPLSVVMAEKIAALRAWADERAVPAG